MVREMIFIFIYCISVLVAAAIIVFFILRKDNQRLGILSEKELEKMRQQAQKEFLRKNSKYLKKITKERD